MSTTQHLPAVTMYPENWRGQSIVIFATDDQWGYGRACLRESLTGQQRIDAGDIPIAEHFIDETDTTETLNTWIHEHYPRDLTGG